MSQPLPTRSTTAARPSSLQTTFDEAVLALVYDRAAELVVAKLEAQGAMVSKRQRKKIAAAFKSGTLGGLKLPGWKWWERNSYRIEFTPEDLEELEGFLNEILDKLPDIMPEVVRQLAPPTSKAIRQDYRRDIRSDRRESRRFEKRLARRWKEPLEDLELAIELAQRLWASARESRQESADGGITDALGLAVDRLHARAIRTAHEVHTLLRAGFADGAMARWRTLHETVVTAAFISEHGQHCAQRYLRHACVDAFRSLEQADRIARKYGDEPPAEEFLAEWREEYQSAIAEFGEAFGENAGWAAPYLSGRRLSFAAIERQVDLERLRPPYRMASGHVHANQQAPWAWLSNPIGDVTVTGPSNFGLAEPGGMTAKSLALITMGHIALAPTLDLLVGAMALSELAIDADIAFDRCQVALIHDDPDLRLFFGVDEESGEVNDGKVRK